MDERIIELLEQHMHVLYLSEDGAPAVWRKTREDGSIFWRAMRDEYGGPGGFRSIKTDHDSLAEAILEAMKK
jgi:hypothetical protein